MGMTAPILHPAQEQSCSIGQQRRARVKNAIGGIGPSRGGQDWVELVAAKESEGLMVH
jgi:hypothetical protein